MCVVTFAGIREQAVVDTGVDMYVPQEGEVNYEDFLVKKSGANK